jgi:hypothetical protein
LLFRVHPFLPLPNSPTEKKNSPIEKIEKKYQKNKIIKIKFFIV